MTSENGLDHFLMPTIWVLGKHFDFDVDVKVLTSTFSGFHIGDGVGLF